MIWVAKLDIRVSFFGDSKVDVVLTRFEPGTAGYDGSDGGESF